jgi:hypothetical protein
LHKMRWTWTGEPFEEEQGFITDKFEFVSRQEAYKIAMECKQIESAEYAPILYSEDIFKDFLEST